MRKTLIVLLCLLSYPAWAVRCEVSAVAPDYGPVDQLLPYPVEATGEVTVRCDLLQDLLVLPNGLPMTVRLAMSSGQSNRFDGRMALNGPVYNHFVDAAHQLIWGDGTQGTVVKEVSVSFPLGQTSATVSVPVYGRVYAGANAPGNQTYLDMLGITATY